jgi:hypothetical protein
VSAVTARSRSTLAAVESDRVRALQHALYRAAKADPTRRFHGLFDKVARSDVLDRAWERVRRNRGAAGIDRITLADVEEYGIGRLLGELAADLKARRYRPLPARGCSSPSRVLTVIPDEDVGVGRVVAGEHGLGPMPVSLRFWVG